MKNLSEHRSSLDKRMESKISAANKHSAAPGRGAVSGTLAPPLVAKPGKGGDQAVLKRYYIPERITVRSGDTLWDLCQRYMGNAYYWPKIWSYNTHISNPHWIYPGNKIRFFPGFGFDKSRVEIGGSMILRSRFKSLIPGGIKMIRHGFISDRKLKLSGKIINSRSEREMLVMGDEVYIKFDNPSQIKVGDRFSAFEVMRDIKHPLSKKKLGNMIRFNGDLTITGSHKGLHIGQIFKSHRIIERGMYLLPYTDTSFRINLRPNQTEVKGYVLDALRERALIDEYCLVFIDKGRKDGVEVGNLFNVVRRRDNSKEPDDYKKVRHLFPLVTVANVVVVSTKDHHCTGVVTRSTKVVYKGDKVVMNVTK